MFKLKTELKAGSGRLDMTNIYNRFYKFYKELHDIGTQETIAVDCGKIWRTMKDTVIVDDDKDPLI